MWYLALLTILMLNFDWCYSQQQVRVKDNPVNVNQTELKSNETARGKRQDEHYHPSLKTHKRIFNWNMTALMERHRKNVEYLHNISEWYIDMETITNTTHEFTYLLNINLVGMAVSVIILGSYSHGMRHLDPTQADFYSHCYRWFLHFMKSLQQSLIDGVPYQVHRRFLIQQRRISTEQFPPLLRLLLPWVKPESWAKEAASIATYNQVVKTVLPQKPYSSGPGKTNFK